ncbi:MAG: hypothetical protein AB4040_12160, partial [Synechococcus sp.]
SFNQAIHFGILRMTFAADPSFQTILLLRICSQRRRFLFQQALSRAVKVFSQPSDIYAKRASRAGGGKVQWN